ncbi:MAG: YdbL family protein [Pseudomonadota bacterium]
MPNLLIHRRFSLAVIAIALLFSLPVTGPVAAQQLDLDTARSQGLVGELPNGLVGALVNDPAVIRLVEEINVERLTAYQYISQAEETPLSTVQTIAGQKIYENVPSGTFIRGQNGSWIKK